MQKTSPKTRRKLLSITSLILIGYGLIICATNRTEYKLFIKLVSLPRIGLGASLVLIGWSILMNLYCLREEKPEKPRKKRRKRR